MREATKIKLVAAQEKYHIQVKEIYHLHENISVKKNVDGDSSVKYLFLQMNIDSLNLCE